MRIVHDTVVQKVQVPDELLVKCPEPDLTNAQTNGDLEQAAGEAIISLQNCNADKQKIREWESKE